MIAVKCTFLKTQSSRLLFSLARHKNAFGQNRKEEAKLKAVAQIGYENQGRLRTSFMHDFHLSIELWMAAICTASIYYSSSLSLGLMNL